MLSIVEVLNHTNTKLFHSYPSTLRHGSGLGRTEYKENFEELGLQKLGWGFYFMLQR